MLLEEARPNSIGTTVHTYAVPLWDRLCGVYRDQPAQARATMRLGVAGYQAPDPLGLLQLLYLPFRPPLAYARTME